MRKNKKFLLTLLAGFVFVVSLPLMAAYEAHVINVTAHIENALYVHPESRNFGTVFPQEYRELGTFVTFSKSFSATDQTRVSKIDYKIVQKPKPRPEFENSAGIPEARKWCHDNYPQTPYDPNNADWQAFLVNCYPSLCPYLSKTPDNLDGNDIGVLPFHDPWSASSIAYGTIDKNSAYVGDNWVVDLTVPCFEGMCAQDWADFVFDHNPNANPDDYMLPADLEDETFGCDLWFEITRIY